MSRSNELEGRLCTIRDSKATGDKEPIKFVILKVLGDIFLIEDGNDHQLKVERKYLSLIRED